MIFSGFFSNACLAQEYEPKIRPDQMEIAGITRNGYTTTFDVKEKQVERGWWTFARTFGRPINMKAYYQLVVPAETTTGNVDLILLSKTIDNKTTTTFFLAIDADQVPEDKIRGYLDQVLLIITQFKKSYYISLLNDTLADLEKKAVKVSKRAQKSQGNTQSRHLNNLENLQKSIVEIKTKIAEIYNTK